MSTIVDTTPTGVPIIDCDACGYRHPISREHCAMCGSASRFPHGVHRDRRTLLTGNNDHREENQ